MIAEADSDSSNDVFNSTNTDENNQKGNPNNLEVKRKLFIGKNIIMDYYKKVNLILYHLSIPRLIYLLLWIIFRQKMSNKIKEREQIFGFAKTPLTEFLNEIDKFKEFPKNFGMMDYKGGTGEEINVKSFYIGDRYASAFSKGIKDNPAIKSLNLSRNNLKDEGFEKIIESVPDGIESIDLSNNDKISLKSYQSLVFMLDDPHKM